MRRWITTGILLALAGGLTLMAGTASAQQANPYTRPDGSWITIGGTVHDLMPNAFTLNYGRGVIRVEMDQAARKADTDMLEEGDTVDVTGRVDDDFLRLETIQAGSVYDARLDKYFYASSLDEDDRASAEVRLPHPMTTEFRGMVTQIGDDEFTIDRGPRKVTVRVDQMESSPLDDTGRQKLAVGDYVSVTAEITHDLFDHRRLEAMDVRELYHD